MLQIIAVLCDTDPGKAKSAIYAFSDFVRGDLEGMTEKELIPFERELEHTKAYIELERLTGEKKFEVEYDLQAVGFMLPPLTLQPVVENAVRHGTADGSARIVIATRADGNRVIIEVEDDTAAAGAQHGTPAVSGEAEVPCRAPATKRDVGPAVQVPDARHTYTKRRSIALENIRARLAKQNAGTLCIERAGGSTKVKIDIRRIDSAGMR